MAANDTISLIFYCGCRSDLNRVLKDWNLLSPLLDSASTCLLVFKIRRTFWIVLTSTFPFESMEMNIHSVKFACFCWVIGFCMYTFDSDLPYGFWRSDGSFRVTFKFCACSIGFYFPDFCLFHSQKAKLETEEPLWWSLITLSDFPGSVTSIKTICPKLYPMSTYSLLDGCISMTVIALLWKSLFF